LASYAAALAIDAQHAEAYTNRGRLLAELGRSQEALADFDRAILLRPDDVPAHCNRAAYHLQLRDIPRALDDLDRAIALQADCAEARFSRAAVSLLSGDYARGWADYEWRWQRDARLSTLTPRQFAEPLWLGQESLAGKTILLHGEQGYGDVLQFCRYAEWVAARGARVVLEVPQALASLLASLDGVTTVIARGQPLPPVDYHCPLMSLPLAFGTSVATIPGKVPYLRVAEAKLQAWQERLGARSKPRVGLVWSGGVRPHRPELRAAEKRRNIPLQEFAPLQGLDIDFYSLQKGQPAESELTELAARSWAGPHLLDFVGELADFSDTAALIENLDLVIAVDTSTAHLAGALGKPVWILNRFDACWRWLLDRTDSPWYPSATLYRQQVPGDWRDVIGRVRADLQREFARA
jgi:hypothetical protein